MEHFAGLDVSVKETSVCIVDDTGKIVREVKVASEPEALLAVLKNPACLIRCHVTPDFFWRCGSLRHRVRFSRWTKRSARIFLRLRVF